MHLTTSDEEMTKNQELITSGGYQTEHQTEKITSNEYITSDTEPRTVYIALRDSKLESTMQQEALMGNYVKNYVNNNRTTLFINCCSKKYANSFLWHKEILILP